LKNKDYELGDINSGFGYQFLLVNMEAAPYEQDNILNLYWLNLKTGSVVRERALRDLFAAPSYDIIRNGVTIRNSIT
jgi:hypothetical protein